MARVRICRKCNIEKPFGQFVLNKNCRYGRERTCKLCRNRMEVLNRKKNPEKANRRARRYVENNRDKVNEANRNWRKKNPEKAKELSRKWFKNNPERAKELRRNQYWRNPEKAHAKLKRDNFKRRSTPEGKLNHSMASNIRNSLMGMKQGRSWEKLVGYSVDQLKNHLAKQFKQGMSWKNYGKWEIDHIIPISAFNFISHENIDFKRCWALKNLQPLWKSENRIKNNKMEKPFQPFLHFKVKIYESI